MSRTRMPALFLGHGSPMNVLEDNIYTRAWRHLGETLARPKAIVVISAHWFTRGTGVTAMEAPKTIHDFGGFPQALYDTHYPAPGSPELAQRLVELLAPVPVTLDKEAWGFDHGSWGVLIKMYPDADIPMVQLSIDAKKHQKGSYNLRFLQYIFLKVAIHQEPKILLLQRGFYQYWLVIIEAILYKILEIDVSQHLNERLQNLRFHDTIFPNNSTLLLHEDCDVRCHCTSKNRNFLFHRWSFLPNHHHVR